MSRSILPTTHRSVLRSVLRSVRPAAADGRAPTFLILACGEDLHFTRR